MIGKEQLLSLGRSSTPCTTQMTQQTSPLRKSLFWAAQSSHKTRRCS